MTLSEIVQAVREQFREKPPNGWLLGWDEFRCFDLVCAAAAPLTTTNFSSFDYGFCNSFQIRVDGDTENRYWTLTVKLSFIVPAYCLYWTQYESPSEGFVLSDAPAGLQSLEAKVREAVEIAGFSKLPFEWHSEQVAGVELDLSDSGKVTLDKCLFQDHSG